MKQAKFRTFPPKRELQDENFGTLSSEMSLQGHKEYTKNFRAPLRDLLGCRCGPFCLGGSTEMLCEVWCEV